MRSLIATFFTPWVLFDPAQLTPGGNSMLEHVDEDLHDSLAELGKAAGAESAALVGVQLASSESGLVHTGVVSISVTPTELDVKTIRDRAAALSGSADVVKIGQHDHVVADALIGEHRLQRAYWRLLGKGVLLMVRAVVLIADEEDAADQRTLLDAGVATIDLIDHLP